MKTRIKSIILFVIIFGTCIPATAQVRGLLQRRVLTAAKPAPSEKAPAQPDKPANRHPPITDIGALELIGAIEVQIDADGKLRNGKEIIENIEEVIKKELPNNNANAELEERPQRIEQQLARAREAEWAMNVDKELNDLIYLPSLTDDKYVKSLKVSLRNISFMVLQDLRQTGAVVSHIDSFYSFEDLPVDKEEVAHLKGMFVPEANRIVVASSEVYTVIHEIGHAMYNTIPMQNIARLEFEETFERELKVYKENGGKVPQAGMKLTEIPSIYCTHTFLEMFAECYVLIMTGTCRGGDVIKEHFPESLAQAKELLTHIRGV